VRGLAGKVAVVAGGAGGIGTATCVRLAEEGAAVVVGDRDGAAASTVAARIADAGGASLALAFDISDEASVGAFFEAAASFRGGVDAVHVNAADLSPAVIGNDSDAVDVDLGLFDHTLAVNLRGHLLCTRRAVPLLLAKGGGPIVYTSSAAAFMGESSRPSYAVAKAGINALVRHVASRWGKEGIRANAVAPGLVITPTVAAMGETEVQRAALRRTSSTRLGRPEDIAAMVAFLLSDDGAWVNGQVVSVDGGASKR